MQRSFFNVQFIIHLKDGILETPLACNKPISHRTIHSKSYTVVHAATRPDKGVFDEFTACLRWWWEVVNLADYTAVGTEF